MSRIFISYRREDSGMSVGRLADALGEHFGRERVFQDISSIDPGADFIDALKQALADCAAVLVVIGPKWLTATDRKGRRRLDDPNDWVRQEIVEALSRPGLRVFPLLVEGAEMPTADELPDVLKPLARRQVYELTVRHWTKDVAVLVDSLKRVPALGALPRPGEASVAPEPVPIMESGPDVAQSKAKPGRKTPSSQAGASSNPGADPATPSAPPKTGGETGDAPVKPRGAGFPSKTVAAVGVGVAMVLAIWQIGSRKEPPVRPDEPTPPIVGGRPATQRNAEGPKPTVMVGQTFRDCDQCPEMVVIPAGHFTMGSPDSESERSNDEGPQRTVTFGQPFAVGKYEVSFDEWDACVTAGGCGHKPSDSGWGRGKQPVVNVSWDDARVYAAWLSKKTGHAYRLLSEAEWEYAARAGTTTRYSWGNEPGSNRANFGGSGSPWSGKQTAPVGSFEPKAFGLYDMIGNVWEWTQDCWNDSYKGAPGDGGAWESGDCGRRVVRGGSWTNIPEIARAANRIRLEPTNRYIYLGFRLARTL